MLWLQMELQQVAKAVPGPGILRVELDGLAVESLGPFVPVAGGHELDSEQQCPRGAGKFRDDLLVGQLRIWAVWKESPGQDGSLYLWVVAVGDQLG